MLVVSELVALARRHGPAMLAIGVMACGHVGLDLNGPETGDGDGDGDAASGGSGSASGGNPNSTGGASSGGSYTSGGSSWAGAQGDGGSDLGGQGGEFPMGGADPAGGRAGSGGQNNSGGQDGSGGEDGGDPICEPDCECLLDDATEDVCSIECLQSPCTTTCKISCEVLAPEEADTQLLVDCRDGAVCETIAPSEDDDLEVTCTGGGTCIVNCGAAETCSTTCKGAGTCEVSCDSAEECNLNCTGEGECKIVGGLLDDIICPLNIASECGDDSVVCGLLCWLLPLN